MSQRHAKRIKWICGVPRTVPGSSTYNKQSFPLYPHDFFFHFSPGFRAIQWIICQGMLADLGWNGGRAGQDQAILLAGFLCFWVVGSSRTARLKAFTSWATSPFSISALLNLPPPATLSFNRDPCSQFNNLLPLLKVKPRQHEPWKRDLWVRSQAPSHPWLLPGLVKSSQWEL